MRHVLRAGLWIFAGAMLAGLVGGYLGAVHPLGDSLAVFRLWSALGVLAAAVGLAALNTKIAAVLALSSFAAAAPILQDMWRATTAPEEVDVRVYSKNILGGRGDADALVADIHATGSDIVFLQEVSRTRNPVRDGLARSHPYQHTCDFSGWSGISILSRWPLTDPYCSPHRSIAAAEVETPFGSLWAASVHLVWPYPYDQASVLARALPELERVDGPVVVAGDFNMVPWGHSVRSLAEVTGTERIGRLYTTLRLRGRIPLQIDHVLTNGAGTTALRPIFGADHHGLSAAIGWPDLSASE